MSEEELLAEKTFLDLFKLSKKDQIKEKNKLYIQAKKLGITKQFERTFNEYQDLFKEKIALNNDIELPKCKYDISNYNLLGYSISIDGITDKSNVKFSYLPVLPVERYINQDTGKEKVKIIYYKENQWKELIVDRSQLAINQKILLLSDYGLDVNSENVRYYIKYFNDIMSVNDINKLESVSHIGWKDKYFIPYDSHGIFDGADEFKSAYQAISSKGNYDKWKECIKELRKHKTIKLLMAVTLASPLLEKLNIQPYIVNLWSSLSGNGKTLSCMVAMSIWGNPAEGALKLSSNNTKNYYITITSFMRNITCYFDELQIIRGIKDFDFDGLIMDLCNGIEKGRLSKSSQAKEVKIWFNNFLFTSNNKLVNENAGEQVYNRVIDLEITDKLIEDGIEVAKIVRNNYGFAGKEYIKYLQKVGFEAISERFNEICNNILKETKSTSKQANSLASMLLANELANECIFDDNYILQVKDILEYVNDRDEIKTCIKAKEYIIDIINANWKKFDEHNYSECWGTKNEEFCTFNYQMLVKELKKGGFEFNTIKKEWSDMDFLRKNTQGKYTHQTTVRSEKGTYVILKLT